jgi:hypothetical protein
VPRPSFAHESPARDSGRCRTHNRAVAGGGLARREVRSGGLLPSELGPKTAAVCAPMSGGCPAAHVLNPSKIFSSLMRPQRRSDCAKTKANCVSSVNSPGRQLNAPPPHISVATPHAGVTNFVDSCSGGPNSYPAPRASPTADPMIAPASCWQHAKPDWCDAVGATE